MAQPISHLSSNRLIIYCRDNCVLVFCFNCFKTIWILFIKKEKEVHHSKLCPQIVHDSSIQYLLVT